MTRTEFVVKLADLLMETQKGLSYKEIREVMEIFLSQMPKD